MLGGTDGEEGEEVGVFRLDDEFGALVNLTVEVFTRQSDESEAEVKD